MQFRVPQFIDVPDRIFGPFTFKQFIYIAGGAGLDFVLYKTLPFIIALIPILFVTGLAALLTFYRVNERSFAEILQSAVRFHTGSKLYIWKKRTKKKVAVMAQSEVTLPTIGMAKLSDSRLKDLSWSLDIMDTSKKA